MLTMLSSATTGNLQSLDAALRILESALENRLRECIGPGALTMSAHPLPAMPPLTGDDAYSLFTREHKLDNASQLLVMLALLPWAQPDLFDRTIQRVLPEAGDYPQVGGMRGRQHRGFLPTGDTVLFLLAGNDLPSRLHWQAQLWGDHPLVKKGIVCLDVAPDGEPPMSGRLIIDSEYAERFLTGNVRPPRMSFRFPAQRLDSAMAWDDRRRIDGHKGVEGFDPRREVRAESVRNRVDDEVAGDQNLVVGQIHHGVALRMSRHPLDLDASTAELEIEAGVERHGGRRVTGFLDQRHVHLRLMKRLHRPTVIVLAHFFAVGRPPRLGGLHDVGVQRVPEIAGVLGDDGRIAEIGYLFCPTRSDDLQVGIGLLVDLVSEQVVVVPMRVHEVTHRLVGQAADCLEVLSRESDAGRIDYENTLVGQDRRRVAVDPVVGRVVFEKYVDAVGDPADRCGV